MAFQLKNLERKNSEEMEAIQDRVTEIREKAMI
jgi:hypothetical protein